METLVERHSLRRMLPLLRSGGADRAGAEANPGGVFPEAVPNEGEAAGQGAESAGDHSGLRGASGEANEAEAGRCGL